MRYLGLLVVLNLFCGVTSMSLADDAEEVKKLNGEWSVASMEMMGKPMPAEAVKNIRLINKDGEYTLKAESEDKGTVTVDATKSPKQMTIKGVEGVNKGKTFLAIYELKEDELKVCYDLSGKEFPKEFKTEAGKLLMLAVYKKVK
jgi:uncharacterized protein (TIGR03067 family)